MTIFQELNALQAKLSAVPIKDLPYIICNEQKQQEILKILMPLPTQHRSTLHLGFSVWFNLDIICKTRPFYAAIFDINPVVYGFIYPVLECLILSCTSREEFVDQFLVKVCENEQHAPFKDYLQDQVKSLESESHGFLANADNFNYLKQMIKEGRVFFGKANLTNQLDMSLIETWIINNELELKTLYLSNIPEWVIQESKHTWDKTKKNISKLIKDDTQVIDAFYLTNRKDGSGPPQRITLGMLPGYQLQRANKISSFHHHGSGVKRRLSTLFSEGSPEGSSDQPTEKSLKNTVHNTSIVTLNEPIETCVDCVGRVDFNK